MGSLLTGRQERAAWVVVGLTIAGFVGFVLYAFFGALVVGLFLYYAMRPVHRRLEDRFDHPDVAATATVLLVGVPVLLVVGYAAVVGVRQFDQFLAAANLQQLRVAVEPYVSSLTAADGGVFGLLRNNVSRVTELTTALVNWALRLFVIVTVAFYLLRDDRKIAGWFRATFADHETAVRFVEHVDDHLTTIYTGNLVTIGATGLIAITVFYGLDLLAPAGTGVAFPVLLGLLVGVATIVPAVGIKAVYFPYTAFLVWRSQTTATTPLWFPVTFFLVAAVALDWFPDFIVRSYLSKGELNMGLVLLTYVLGAVAFGWYGVFFGPVVLVFFTTFAREILPELT
ncbi:AI-2E family transporter [Halomicrobium zhouii]|nr:AI-2E family transporter [Halomicrobium zhouii]